MMENIVQCCYTNAIQENGGKISSGWQPVAVSENIPAEAYNYCVSMQNANSTIQSRMVDEQGNTLNLFEINGDGSYVYVCRTQFGLVDRLGRPNMFSHAYIFPWKNSDIIEDPNSFLTITGDNFATDEESASKPKAFFDRSQPRTICSAMEKLGMDSQTYMTLIRCVFAQYSDRSITKPLYVQYDGTEEQMQDILYCIYFGLPYYIRRNLSVASVATNTTEGKNLVFSIHADTQEYYVDPKTGKNSVVTARSERKIERYGYADHVARNYMHIDANAYFRDLEQMASELGDSTASNELILKIAHLLLENQNVAGLEDEELNGRLSDALRSKSLGSKRMEDYISDMITAVFQRKLVLGEELLASLSDRLAKATTNRLAEVGELYNIFILTTHPLEEAAKILSRMDSAILDRYCKILVKSENGVRILDYYYSEYGLAGKEITWNSLNDLVDKTCYVPIREEIREKTEQLAWELYEDGIAQKQSVVSTYGEFIFFMQKWLSATAIVGCERSAKEVYWDSKAFEQFSVADLVEYNAMRIEVDKADFFIEFAKMLHEFEYCTCDEFLKKVNTFAIKHQQFITTLGGEDAVLGKISSEVLETNRDASEMHDWVQIALCANTELLFNEILELRNDMQRRDCRGFNSTYRMVRQDSMMYRNKDRLLKNVGKRLEKTGRSLDIVETIPLDIWLILGEMQYSNPYRIFDTGDQKVLFVDSVEVVAGSELLIHNQDLGEEYIENKGLVSKTVRKWLNEIKMAEKRKVSEEKRAKRTSESTGWPLLNRNQSHGTDRRLFEKNGEHQKNPLPLNNNSEEHPAADEETGGFASDANVEKRKADFKTGIADPNHKSAENRTGARVAPSGPEKPKHLDEKHNAKKGILGFFGKK